MKDKDKILSQKIIKYCSQIQQTHDRFGDDEHEFYDDSCGFIYRNAISMPIQQIGELAKSYSDEFISEISDIPWKQIKGMRTYFAHEYDEMDIDVIWKTSHEEIDSLKEKLERILNDKK